MGPLWAASGEPVSKSYETNYYRVIFTLFGIAYLFSFYNSGPQAATLREFLIGRNLFALLPLSLVALSYLIKFFESHIKDIASGYFLLCTLHLVGFFAVNNFILNYEIGIIAIVLFSNFHLNKVLYIVLYNVIVLSAIEYVFITAEPQANVQPLLLFLFLLIVMIISVFYQLYRIRVTEKITEAESLTTGLIKGNPDAWITFEGPGLVAVNASERAMQLFGLKNISALDDISLRNIVDAPSSAETDALIKNILTGPYFETNVFCKKPSGETFEAHLSAYRIPGRTNYIQCRFFATNVANINADDTTENAIRYRSYLDIVDYGIIICDTRGTIKLCNKKAVRLLDKNNIKSFAGKQLFDLTGTETAKEILDNWNQLEVSSGNQVSTVEFKSGNREIIFQVRKITDIIDQKAEMLIDLQPRKQLTENEHQDKLIPHHINAIVLNDLSDILKDADIPFTITDKTGNIINSNDALHTIIGYTSAELSTLKLENLIHPDDIPAYRLLKPQMEPGQSGIQSGIESELRLIHKKGDLLDIRMNISEIILSNKTGHFTLQLFTDITTYKTTSRKLMEAGSNVKAVVENTDDPIFSVDFNHRFTVMNMAFKNDCKKRNLPEPKPGDDYRNFLSVEDVSHWKRIFNQVMKGTQTKEDKSISYSDGTIEYFEVSYNPISTQQNIQIGIAVYARKVTERIRFEHELVKAKEIAENATRAKSEFLSTMSHEIRTPLNGLVGMAELLKTTPLTNKQKEYLNSIELSGEALLSVINDVLDYSRIESDKLILEDKTFELKSCITDTFTILNYKAGEKGNKLFYRIDSSLPQFVSGDKARIRQILVNLVGNAIKFTNNGNIEVHVKPEQVIGDHLDLRFAVSDTGIGMTADQTKNLFQSFSQADTSTYRKYGGSGLGLAISARLTALMKGNIWVDSKPGEGSTFYFVIRVKTLNATQQEQQRIQQSVKKSDISEKSSISADLNTALKILVAEDNIINQKLIKVILNNLGYSPDFAENGRTALEMALNNRYDIIFMDIQMPEMDGIEATTILLKQLKGGRTPIIIAMTAFAMEGDREKCLEAGMTDYLAKPFKTDDIKQLITKYGKSNINPVQVTVNKDGSKNDSIESIPEYQYLDFAMVEQLKSMADGDQEFLKTLATMFIEQSEEIINNMLKESQKQDFTALEKSAHKLKGSALNLGVKKLAELCKQVENGARENNIKIIESSLLNIHDTFIASSEALKKAVGIK